jgi:hypothetical protein
VHKNVRKPCVLKKTLEADIAESSYVRVVVVEIGREGVELGPLGRHIAEQRAAWTEDAPDLTRHAQGCLNVLEDLLESNDVEGARSKGQVLAGTFDDCCAGRCGDARGESKRFNTDGIEPGVETIPNKCTVAAADIEYRCPRAQGSKKVDVAREQGRRLAKTFPIRGLSGSPSESPGHAISASHRWTLVRG